MTNRYEYYSPDGGRLRAERDEEGVHIETSPYGCLVEPGHLEEVVAGLRDMARQASGAPPAPSTPVDVAAVYRKLADEQDATAATDVIRRRRSIATARRVFAVELRRMAEEAGA